MIAPLPIRTRLIADETLQSYAQRLAERNFTTVASIETALVARGELHPQKSWLSSQRAAAWRALGSIQPEGTFWETRAPGLGAPIERLCDQCSGYAIAYGYLRTRGMVCLKHRRWIGERQTRIHYRPHAINAERRYRSILLARAAGLGTWTFALAGECARLSFAGRAQNLEPQWRTIAEYLRTVDLAIVFSSSTAAQVFTTPHTSSASQMSNLLLRIQQITGPLETEASARIDVLLANARLNSLERPTTVLWSSPSDIG